MQTEESQRGRGRLKYYVACMYSLQSFLVKPCCCLSPDKTRLSGASCWLCLHDISPDMHTRPRQQREVFQTNQMVGGWRNTPLFRVMLLFLFSTIHNCSSFNFKIALLHFSLLLVKNRDAGFYFFNYLKFKGCISVRILGMVKKNLLNRDCTCT